MELRRFQFNGERNAIYDGQGMNANTAIFCPVGTLVGEPMESRGYPNPRVLEECRLLGKTLAESVARE